MIGIAIPVRRALPYATAQKAFSLHKKLSNFKERFILLTLDLHE
jgi:hypothetical protein